MLQHDRIFIAIGFMGLGCIMQGSGIAHLLGALILTFNLLIVAYGPGRLWREELK